MNELKVRAYDLLVEIEKHQIEIQKLQQQLQEVNKQINEQA